jgi:hypothetical protein
MLHLKDFRFGVQISNRIMAYIFVELFIKK